MPHPNFIFPPSPGRGKGVKSFTKQDGANPYFPERNFTISGVTKDSTGAPLGNCVVMLYLTDQMNMVQMINSDASGNYSFTVDKTLQWYVTAYKAGAPDVAGSTVNTLTGV